jgi:hypothetical protein
MTASGLDSPSHPIRSTCRPSVITDLMMMKGLERMSPSASISRRASPAPMHLAEEMQRSCGVYVYVCVYVCVDDRVYTYTHARAHTHIHIQDTHAPRRWRATWIGPCTPAPPPACSRRR